jgi:hypothetical protein
MRSQLLFGTAGAAALLALGALVNNARAEDRPAAAAVEALATPAGTSVARLAAAFGRLPLGFEPNAGQSDSRVKFLAQGRGYTVFLLPDQAVFRFDDRWPAAARDKDHQADAGGVLRMQLLGANTHAPIGAEQRLPGRSNYLLGNDPRHWHTNIANYGRVRIEGIYPGVDLLYYGNQDRRLEYDFIVAPGADPGLIRLQLQSDGPQRAGESARGVLRLDASGDLVVRTGHSEMRLRAPAVYQLDGAAAHGLAMRGERTPVAGRFELLGANQVRVALGPYDHSRALIIDPTLVYSTYLGGSNSDAAVGIAADAAGNSYISGNSASVDFPLLNPLPGISDAGSAFITKMNAAGTALLYSTRLGGMSSGETTAYSIALDSGGNAYVTGETQAVDFPTVNAIQPAYSPAPSGGDSFLSKLNASGSALVYSTYLGGSGTNAGCNAYAVAVDTSGNAYVAGATYSAGFQTVNPLQGNFAGAGNIPSGFAMKINVAGSAILWSTFLGGSGGANALGIAADSSGNAYVTGWAGSEDFPTSNPLQQCLSCPGANSAFISKINPSGSAFIYSTFLGGTNSATGYAIATDTGGNAYVTGITTASDFPTVNPVQASNHGAANFGANVFVSKLNASGTALVYSTYLGGTGQAGVSADDWGRAIAVDASGAAYVAGSSNSTDFPTLNAVQTTKKGDAGSDNAFLFSLTPAGSSLVYSTFLGGTDQGGNSGGDIAYGVAVDASGNAYIAGQADSSDFPTTMNAYQPAMLNIAGREGSMGFVAKFTAAGGSSPAATVTLSAAPATIALGQSTLLTWSSSNATACTASGAWSGAQSLSGSLSETPAATGTSTFTLTCTGPGASANASASVTIDAAPTASISVSPTTISEGGSALLSWSSTNATACTASGAWSGPQSTSGSLSVSPSGTGQSIYTLTCTGVNGSSSVSAATLMVQLPTVTVLSGHAGGGSFGAASLGLLLLSAMWCLKRRLMALGGAAPAVLLLAVLFGIPRAQAQAGDGTLDFDWSHSYLGVRAGYGRYWESSAQLDADLIGAGYSTTATNISQQRAAGVLYAGVPFYRSFALELGVADLGLYPVKISTYSNNIPQLAQSIVHDLSPAGRGLTLGVAAPFNLNAWLALQPRLAALAFESTQQLYAPSGTVAHERHGGGLDGGLMLLARPSSSLAFGVGVDCFDTSARCDVLLYSAELEYHFGH